MINRLGVKPCLCLFLLLSATAGLAGCASAPISMQAEDNAALMAEQVELRAHANRLADRLDEAGWSVSATPAEATRSFFGRLIGGADAVEDDAPDTVATYLAMADMAQVGRDLEALTLETRALADMALAVASADGALESSSLARDLAAVERALGAVRRADQFFDAVSAAQSWSETDRTALASGVEALDAVTPRLSTAADALAERRWASRSGLFG